MSNRPIADYLADTGAVPAGSALAGTERLPGLDGTTLKTWTTAQVLTYILTGLAGVLRLQGNTDCSSNPNYPAASKGDLYYVTVAGKIGGASGTSVDIGDAYIAKADNAGGTQAAVGASWFVLEHNIVGALLSANNLSDLASASTARANLGLAIGTNVQAYSAALALYAAISPSANVQSLLGAANYAAIRALLNLVTGADVQAYSAAIAPPIPSGQWMHGEGFGASATGTAPGASSMRMYPVRVRRAVTITDLALKVLTAAASGNVQVAIYAADAATLAPTGAPLFSSASQSTASTGVVGPSSVATTLAPGIYWFATNSDASAATAAYTSRGAGNTGQVELVGATTAANALNSGSVTNGYAKSQTFGTWPTLTGNYTTDSLTEVTTATIPAVAFKA